MSVARAHAARLVLEFLPAGIVAFALLPWIIASGDAMPWRPAMLDLEVYRVTVADLLGGGDIYETRASIAHLPFIYPPIAAILMVPFGVLPSTVLQVVWTLGGLFAQWVVLKRCGVGRGIPMAWAMVTLVLAIEPIRTTLGYGQINTMLMALVVADLLPHPQRRRWFPAGTWIGLAAAVKLTPLLFVVLLFAARRWRHAWGALASFGFLTGFGALILPHESLAFVRKVVTGDMYGDPVYSGNQSLAAFADREFGSVWAGLAFLGLAGLLALGSVYIGGVLWDRSADSETRWAHRVWVVGMVGMTTCLVSPISWTHHHVWLVPLALGALAGGLPLAIRVTSLAWAGWVALCIPLTFLPYGEGRELEFTWYQRIAVEVTPVLGVVILLLALGWTFRGARGGAGPVASPVGRRVAL